MIQLPLVSTNPKFAQTSADNLINSYAEEVSKGVYDLRTTPGLLLKYTLSGNGGIRGIHTMVAGTERLFAVRGYSFQEYDPLTGEFVERGILGTANNPVSMANNGTQIIVVDGEKGYGYTPGDTGSFAEITAFPGTAQDGAIFSATRILSFDKGTGFFYCSDQDSVYNWSGTAGAEAESFPDPLVAIASLGQILFLLGSGSYEVWVDQGYNDFPFRRVQAGSNIGCAAQYSVATFGGSVFFLGGSAEGRGIVYKTSGYDVTRISDNRREEIIQSMPDFSDAIGYVYQEQGHVFYVLNFTAGDKTLVFDMTTGLWTERKYRNPANGIESHRFETSQAVFSGMNLVGDFRNGNIYQCSRNYFTDNGASVIRRRIFPVWPTEQIAFVSVPSFAVYMDMGNTPSGVESPRMMLNWSDDRGKTYGYEIDRSVGRNGEYGKRIVWHGLGSTYGRNFQLSWTGDQDFVIRNAGLLDEYQ